MNREEFMKALAGLLINSLESEREEVLQYYNNYFDDAGSENESKVIAELSSPEKVAKTIQTGMNDKLQGNYEFTDSGFHSNSDVPQNQLASINNEEKDEWKEKDTLYSKKKKKMSGSTTALLVFIMILTFPIWIGLVAGIFGVTIGIIAVAFSMIIVLVILMIIGAMLGIIFIVLGLFFMGLGIFQLFISPAVGISMLGGGMIMEAIGILCMIGMILLCGVVIPWVIKGIIQLIKWPFHKKEDKQL